MKTTSKLFLISFLMLSFAACNNNKIEKIELCLHLNGGVLDGDSSSIITKDIKSINQVENFLPTKEGYVFSNWYFESSFRTPFDTDISYDKKIDLYASYYEDYFDYEITPMGVSLVKMNKNIETSYTLPNYVLTKKLSTIKANAFSDVKIKSLFVNETLEKIEKAAFSGAKIESIKINSNVKEIEYGAFLNPEYIFNVFIEDGKRYSASNGLVMEKLDGYNRRVIGQYGKDNTVFHESLIPFIKVVDIAPFSFSNIRIYSGDPTVQGFSFHMPKTVTKINDDSFFGCKVNRVTDSSTYRLKLGMLFSSKLVSVGKRAYKDSNLSLIKYENKLSENGNFIPSDEGVELFDEEAFMNTSYSYLTLPKSLKVIKKDCFKGARIQDCIYYEGTKEDFEKIEIEEGNDILKNTNIIYFSEEEQAGYWHFSGSDGTTPYVW